MSIISQKTGLQTSQRFEISSNNKVAEIQDIFRKALNAEDAPFEGKVRLGYISIYPLESDHHYWSPNLSFTTEEDDTGDGSIIKELYGASPTVWTKFAFAYAFIALSAVVAVLNGFIHMSNGESPPILWAVPFLIFLFISMFLVSSLGKKRILSNRRIPSFFRKMYWSNYSINT